MAGWPNFERTCLQVDVSILQHTVASFLPRFEQNMHWWEGAWNCAVWSLFWSYGWCFWEVSSGARSFESEICRSYEGNIHMLSEYILSIRSILNLLGWMYTNRWWTCCFYHYLQKYAGDDAPIELYLDGQPVKCSRNSGDVEVWLSGERCPALSKAVCVRLKEEKAESIIFWMEPISSIIPVLCFVPLGYFQRLLVIRLVILLIRQTFYPLSCQGSIETYSNERFRELPIWCKAWTTFSTIL